MDKLKFRAIIKYNLIQQEEAKRLGDENIEYAVKFFQLEDFVKPLFSVRELLLPWLKEGNIPDLYVGYNDKRNVEIYCNDYVEFEHDIEEENRIAEIHNRDPNRCYLEDKIWKSVPSIGFNLLAESFDEDVINRIKNICDGFI